MSTDVTPLCCSYANVAYYEKKNVEILLRVPEVILQLELQFNCLVCFLLYRSVLFNNCHAWLIVCVFC